MMKMIIASLEIIRNLFPGEYVDEQAAIEDNETLFGQWKEARDKRPWITDKANFGQVAIEAYGYPVGEAEGHEVIFTGMNAKTQDGVKGMSVTRRNAYFQVGKVGEYNPEMAARLTFTTIDFDDKHKDSITKVGVNTFGIDDTELQEAVEATILEAVSLDKE